MAWAAVRRAAFLACISRGRTIRQFVLGAMAILFPSTSRSDLDVFGNAALESVRAGNTAPRRHRCERAETGFYMPLRDYPCGSCSWPGPPR
ncbi:hypothetical protein HBB16_21805 [Pseudonocardia sp. MCCB 268]|nr:hypothetical protein [Pseudonocardia cytotoxica]